MIRLALRCLVVFTVTCAATAATKQATFFKAHCVECHDADTKKGNLDLTALKPNFADAENFARWVKVHDRIESGEMPPKKKARPPAKDTAVVVKGLRESLLAAEQAKLAGTGRTGLRRLTRAEYENTLRDLFDMPGIALQGNLPADGSAHGFDKNSDALDISHVNLAKYVEAAEHALELATATRPIAPTVQQRRISLMNSGGFVTHVVLNGDGVLLKNKQPAPGFPPAGPYDHLDQGAHERLGNFTYEPLPALAVSLGVKAQPRTVKAATTGAAVPFTATPAGGDWPRKVDFALPLGHSEIVLAEPQACLGSQNALTCRVI